MNDLDRDVYNTIMALKREQRKKIITIFLKVLLLAFLLFSAFRIIVYYFGPEMAYLVLFMSFVFYIVSKKIHNNILQTQSKYWSKVTGTILNSGYSRKVIAFTRFGNWYGGYKLKVSYSYSIDGKDYLGHRISFFQRSLPTLDMAERFSDKFEYGDEVEVYYSPKNPKQSVLILGE